MPELTIRQQLADFCANYGLPKVYLRAYEEVAGFGIDSRGRAVVTIERWRVTETRTQLKYTAHGLIMRAWEIDPGDGDWRERRPMLTWDDDFEPHIVAKYNGRTPDEHRAKLLFEAECYRPGTDTSPMDNFDRTAAYPSMATEPMRKHWGL